MMWIILSLLLAIIGVQVHHALLLGLFMALILELVSRRARFLPQAEGKERSFSKYILQFAVTILGACLPLSKLISFGIYGLAVTFFSILAVLGLGLWLGKVLGLRKPLVMLISFGTAICGGSAIAALASTIKAKNHDVAISLLLVFLLNALALFIFPSIGQFYQLSDMQFGKWVALSIHDTSSVLGASSLWSKDSLTIATTLKLVRAMWIVPFTFFFAIKTPGSNTRAKVPGFILAFVFMSLLASIFPSVSKWEPEIKTIAKMAMASSLFLMGLSLKVSKLRELPIKTVFHALSLWIIVSVSSLILISYHII